ncbi:ABC transporter substrate-binding protein [Cohnella cellulosilytica]|uniref:ABC transporter substrate-binding protein n=1 Tax=Cohnella cellulosilytica TaxID=986710 RepID=A0ABW2FM14_9BACL
MNKRLGTVSLCLLILLGLFLVSACSSNSSQTGEASSNDNPDASESAEVSSPVPAQDNGGEEQVVIRHTMHDHEFTPEKIAEFEQEHPNIKIETVPADYNKLMSMIAAGDVPDIIRVDLSELPGYVIKGMALDLTDYFNGSPVLRPDDFLPIVNQFRFDSDKRIQGEGPIYGFPMDVSPDFSMVYNKKLFEAAKVPFPSSTEAMSWSELAELAKKLTKKDGDQVTQYGLAYYKGDITANQDLLNLQLLQLGSSAYSADFTSADYTTPEIKNLLQFWADTTEAAIGPNPLHPATEWVGQLFVDNKVGMMMIGYRGAGFLKANPSTKDRLDDFGVAPAPVADNGTRISPTGFGTGAMIYSQSKHPKEAWTVYEWFLGGKPEEELVKASLALPGTHKLMELLPKETEFDKMNFEFIQNELKYNNEALPFNPYLTYQAVDSVFEKYFTPVYYHKDTVDGAAKKITEELNILIREGMQLLDNG